MFHKARMAVATSVAVAFLVGAVRPLPALCKMTSEQLSKIIDDSKVLGSDTDVRAELHEDASEAVIFASRNPKATDKDCKIDAVLIAKKVMDVDPSGVTKVKVTFLDQSNKSSYREVTVRAGDVKAYAARVIDQQTLLEELEIQRGQTANQPAITRGTAQPLEVVPGPLSHERATLRAQIQALQSKGVGVGPFMAQFNLIEDKAKTGTEAELTGPVQKLAEILDQQRDQLKKIQEQKLLQRTERENRIMEQRRRMAGMPGMPPPEGMPEPPPDGSFGGPGGGPGGGPDDDRHSQGRLSHEELEKQWKEEKKEEWKRKMANLGDLTPVDGPCPMRRGWIALRLKAMRDRNQDISPYMPAWNDLERLASNKDKSGTEARAAYMENLLNIGKGRRGQDDHHNR